MITSDAFREFALKLRLKSVAKTNLDDQSEPTAPKQTLNDMLSKIYCIKTTGPNPCNCYCTNKLLCLRDESRLSGHCKER